MTIKTKGMGTMQKWYLRSLCEKPIGAVLPWVAMGDTATTERIGISLAKRGLVDGDTEQPALGYAEHTINQAGRQWVHDYFGPNNGWRWVLTGKELTYKERIALHDVFDSSMDVTQEELTAYLEEK